MYLLLFCLADFSSAIHELANYFIDTFGSIEDGEMSKCFVSAERSVPLFVAEDSSSCSGQ